MNTLVISGLAGISIFLFFLFITIFSKKEDYMLDDYTEDEKPDNVRIIEREIPKIIEKEVIVEKEVEIFNTKEEERLRSIVDQKNKDINELQNSIETHINESKNAIELLNSKVEDYENHIKTLNITIDKNRYSITELEDEKNNKSKEVTELKDTIEKLEKDNNLLSTSIREGDKENNILIENLKRDISDKDFFITKLEKDIKEYKNKVTQSISDRDHFIKVLEDRTKEIDKLKDKIKTIKNSFENNNFVYEGVDDYGKFYDIHNLNGHIPKENIPKINEINEQLDSDRFAYYTINTESGHEGVTFYDISELDKKMANLSSIHNKNGKYKIYVINKNRVYLFLKH